MHRRIHCKVRTVNLNTRALEKPLKTLHLRMRTRTASFAVSLCRACYVHLLVLGPRLGSKRPQDGRRCPQDGHMMAPRWPKMGHKAVLEVAFDR